MLKCTCFLAETDLENAIKKINSDFTGKCEYLIFFQFFELQPWSKRAWNLKTSSAVELITTRSCIKNIIHYVIAHDTFLERSINLVLPLNLFSWGFDMKMFVHAIFEKLLRHRRNSLIFQQSNSSIIRLTWRKQKPTQTKQCLSHCCSGTQLP